MVLKAHVRQGHLVVDDRVDLPEAIALNRDPFDPGDDLDDDDRALLHEALSASAEDAAAGRFVEAETVLAELRSA